MDALIPAFVVALLAELGDRTQFQAIRLAERYQRTGAVLAGIGFGALLNLGIGAAAGIGIAHYVTHQPLQLLTGLALIFAGAGAAFRVKPPPSIEGWRLGAFASSAGAFLILSLGDKTQFMTATIAASSGQPILSAAGATAGVVVGNLPAVILGERWPRLAPLRLIRVGAGILLGLAGILISLDALALV